MIDETAIFTSLQTYVWYENTTVLELYSYLEITVLGNLPTENAPPDKSALLPLLLLKNDPQDYFLLKISPVIIR